VKLSDILLRALGVPKWQPSKHYAECRRLAEQRLGDLSLPGERDDAGAEMGNWPRLGCPFDEPTTPEARRAMCR
jgi:hypothetical protein